MNIVLYVNTAENERLDKTSYLQEVTSLEGTLRESSSMLTPTILFELPNQEPTELVDEDDEIVETADADIVVDSSLIYNFNYAYIEEFNRYYYVQDIVIVRNRLFSVTLVCDVLMSFMDEILSLHAYVDRNEFDFSALLEDNLMPFEYEKEVTEIDDLDGGALVNTHFKSKFEWDSKNIVGTFIYEIAGTGSVDQVDKPTDSGLNDISIINFVTPDNVFAITPSTLDSINKTLVGDTGGEYSSFIKALIALPFEPPNLGFSEIIRVGKEDGINPKTFNNARGYPMKNMSNYIVIADFEIPDADDFTDFAPYSNYELFIPFYGWTALNYMDVKGCRIIVYYSVNYSDGSATAYVWNVTKERVVFTTSCQLGIALPVNSSNNYELQAREQANALNLAVGAISSVASIGIGVATSNPIAIVGGVLSAGKAVASFANSNAQMFDRASSSFSGSQAGMYSPLKCRLRKTAMVKRIGLDMPDYAHQVGRPMRLTKPLFELRGFTIVNEIHLENINAFKKEKDEIERLLKTGVIL